MAYRVLISVAGPHSVLIETIGITSPKLLALWRSRTPMLLDRCDVPEEAFVISSHKVIPDFIAIAGYLSVSASALAKIRSIDPYLEQFFPVRLSRQRGRKALHTRDGTVLAEPYHLFNSLVLLNAVCIKRSEVEVIHLPFNRGELISPARAGNAGYKNIVLDRNITKGHHFWKGGNHLSSDYFMSNSLYDSVLQNKFKGLSGTFIKEEQC